MGCKPRMEPPAESVRASQATKDRFHATNSTQEPRDDYAANSRALLSWWFSLTRWQVSVVGRKAGMGLAAI